MGKKKVEKKSKKKVVFSVGEMAEGSKLRSVCTEPEGISLDVVKKGISGNVSAERSATPCVPSAHICVFSRNSRDGQGLGLILLIFCCFCRITDPGGLHVGL